MRISRLLARILNKLHWLPLFNGSVAIGINNKKFIIPLLGRQGYDNLNLSEPWMTKVLLALRPLFNGNFTDVGVNLGQTLLKAHAVFDELNYLGFEPNPSCVHYVQEMVLQNNIKKAEVLPIAVGKKTELLRLNFFASDNSDSSATIIEDLRPNVHTDHFIYVPVFDFHQVSHFLPAEPFSILKIDVEGAELEVLLGLNEWIAANNPFILLEILPVYSAENQDRLERQHKIEALLITWNYKIARIKKKDQVALENLETIGIHSNIEDCDYLLYHASLNTKIKSCFNSYN